MFNRKVTSDKIGHPVNCNNKKGIHRVRNQKSLSVKHLNIIEPYRIYKNSDIELEDGNVPYRSTTDLVCFTQFDHFHWSLNKPAGVCLQHLQGRFHWPSLSNDEQLLMSDDLLPKLFISYT